MLKMEEQNFLIMAGQSKAERLFQEDFTVIHKKSALQIIEDHGANVYAIWSILQFYCYGSKAHAFPKVDTLAKQLKKSERTVQRWLNELEKANGVKIVPTYWEKTGLQTSNLYVVNPDFPEVPEWWENCFQHGAIRTKVGEENRFYERPEPSNFRYDKNVTPETSGTTKMSPLENLESRDQNAENPVKSGMTNLSPLENQGSDAKSGKNGLTSGTTNLSPHEERKDIYIQEIKIDNKKNNNNNCTYIENYIDTYNDSDEEKSVVVVVAQSHKSEIRSQFEEKIGLQLTDSLLDELIELTKGNLVANQQAVTSEAIVARLSDYIHKVDKYNRPFKTNGYVVLKTAIQNNYQYIDAEQETAPSVQPRGKKYEMLRNRQSEERSITEEEERIRNKRIELRKQQLKVNDQIHLLQNKDFLSQEQEAQLAALKEEMEKLKKEIAWLDQQLEQIAV